jgi:hypothetical protein
MCVPLQSFFLRSFLFFPIFMHKIRKKRFCCACAHVDAKISRNILMFYAYVLCAHKKAENPKILCAHKTYAYTHKTKN